MVCWTWWRYPHVARVESPWLTALICWADPANQSSQSGWFHWVPTPEGTINSTGDSEVTLRLWDLESNGLIFPYSTCEMVLLVLSGDSLWSVTAIWTQWQLEKRILRDNQCSFLISLVADWLNLKTNIRGSFAIQTHYRKHNPTPFPLLPCPKHLENRCESSPKPAMQEGCKTMAQLCACRRVEIWIT